MDRYQTVRTLSAIAAVALLLWAWATFPPLTIFGANWLLLAVYFLLLTLAQTFPVKFWEDYVAVTMGIGLPMFLRFGAVATVIFLVASWMASRIALKKQMNGKRLLPVFSMYTILVIVSAKVFRAFGGSFVYGAVPAHPLALPVTAFFISNFFLYSLLSLLYMISTGQSKRWLAYFKSFLAASLIETVLVFLFFILLRTYGQLAFFYMAAPFAAVLYMLRSYSNMLQANQQLIVINEVTAQISSEFHEDALLQSLADGVFRLVNTLACYVFIWDEEQSLLVPAAVRGRTEELEKEMRQVKIRFGEGVSGYAFMKRQALLQRRRNELPLKQEYEGYVPLQSASFLAVPLMYQDLAVGVLTLTHTENNAFTKKDRDMVQILANHGSIAVSNLRRFAVTKERNYTDELTGLYNFRYFEKVFSELCAACDREHHGLVLLVLDIDHFKRINDTYGHLAGNEVLKKIARILRDQVRELDVVCRYGGEEFTVMLPKANLDVGRQIAERLRMAIEHATVSLPSNDLVVHMPIRVTVSVGVACYPEMGDTPMDVLRHADRALYVGSKQKGRNRVAIYEG